MGLCEVTDPSVQLTVNLEKNIASTGLFDALQSIRRTEVEFGEVRIKDVNLHVRVDLLQIYDGDEVQLEYQTDEFDANFIKVSTKKVQKKLIIDSTLLTKPVVTFRDEGNFYAEGLRSDLVVRYEVATPPEYSWRGTDLLLRQEIDLKAALLSRSLQVTNINGKTLTVTIEDVISPTTVIKVPGEGFRQPDFRPSNRNTPVPRGDFYVTFEVRFPEFLSLENRKIVQRILSK